MLPFFQKSLYEENGAKLLKICLFIEKLTVEDTYKNVQILLSPQIRQVSEKPPLKWVDHAKMQPRPRPVLLIPY